MDSECLEKLTVLTSFCIARLNSLPIPKREFYYIWRYVLVALGIVIEKCGVASKVKSICQDIDFDVVRNSVAKIMNAQYSAVTNEDIVKSLSKLCPCIVRVLALQKEI